MSNPKDFTKKKLSMSVMNAIQHRRSVRDYTSQAIGEKVIRTLLDAAVHAPTAMHEEPWSFATRRYRNRRIGEFLKELSLTEGRGTGVPKM